MQQIIVMMGTDGSGKTTLSDELVTQLRADGVDAVREWLGAESYLMAPIRRALRRLYRGQSGPATKTGGSAAYREEIQKKNELAKRHGWAARGYVAAVMADYRMQLNYKRYRNRRRELLVADRYVFDVIVNLALALGWTIDQTILYAQQQLSHFPWIRLGVLVRVSPEISMSRKDDIPDIDYLRLRQSYYDAIASAFGFTVIDGALEIARNAADIRQLIERMLATPTVHYVHSNNQDVGGADMVLVSMAQQMREGNAAGYRTLVHLRLPTMAARAHARVGTPVILSDFVRPQSTVGVAGAARMLFCSPVTVAHFYRLFRRERPDIVHVNDLYDFLPAIAARLVGIPVAFHLRMIKSGFMGRVFSGLLPILATATISVSEAVRSHYDFRRVPPAGNVVIHDLANPQLVQHDQSVSRISPRPAGVSHRGRLITMVGRLEHWKGQHVFLEAVEKLPTSVRESNTFVLVGGQVPEKEEYAEMVRQEADRLGVTCLGVRTDVPPILLASDISVHCSIEPDPFPGVVIESLLAGAATVAANGGGVPEIINGDDVGITYTPGDATELCGILLELLSEPESPRLRRADAGRARALELVSAEAVNSQLASVYAALIDSNRKNRSGCGVSAPMPSKTDGGHSDGQY